MGNFGTLDIVIVVIYFVVIGAMGLWVSRGPQTTAKYFVANRSIPTWAVAFTLMATMISSGTIIGNPATSYKDGMILLLGHATLPFVLLFVAFFIVPFYRNVVGMSAYEYINLRFGVGTRIYASLGFLGDRIFDVGVTLLTTALPIAIMTGWDLNTILIGVGLFTVAYTLAGGIEAVVWTNAVQGVIIVLALIVILYELLFAVDAGGPGAVIGAAWESGRFQLGDFSLNRESFLPSDTASQWLIITAYALNWGRRYITDQHMVQRYLLARSDREARSGALWGACSCVPLWFFAFFIGSCLYGYYQVSGAAVVDVNGISVPQGLLEFEGIPGGDAVDSIVPYFLVNNLPTGLLGLLLAAIMAASMSSISADLNSISTVVTTDYFVPLRPKSEDKTRLLFGRFVVFLMGLFMIWVAFVMKPGEGKEPIMERVITIASILAGGAVGLFFLGFLTRRATRKGAYAGIAACIVYYAWGLTTQGDSPLIDMGGFNFGFHPMMLGVLSHFVVFITGFVVSMVFGGHRPDDVDQLTIRRKHPTST